MDSVTRPRTRRTVWLLLSQLHCVCAVLSCFLSQALLRCCRCRPAHDRSGVRAQAGAHVPGNLGAVRGLLEHPAFALSNPNMCYSLFLSFLRSTPNFHAADGSGYAFLADSILQVQGPSARQGLFVYA